MRSILLALVVASLGVGATVRADDARPMPPSKSKKAELMDINTATADQLKTLPGITDEIAAKIIAGRPYQGKDALAKQKIVDQDEYKKVQPLIIAKQAKVAKPDAAPAPPPPAAERSMKSSTAAPPSGAK